MSISVLFVDDNKLEHQLFERALRKFDCAIDIQGFELPDEALTFLESTGLSDTDIMVVDINMPRLDGFELLRQAEAQNASALQATLVIMLSGSTDPRDIERANESPVIDFYFQKPLTAEAMERVRARLANDNSSGIQE